MLELSVDLKDLLRVKKMDQIWDQKNQFNICCLRFPCIYKTCNWGQWANSGILLFSASFGENSPYTTTTPSSPCLATFRLYLSYPAEPQPTSSARLSRRNQFLLHQEGHYPLYQLLLLLISKNDLTVKLENLQMSIFRPPLYFKKILASLISPECHSLLPYKSY